MREIITDVLVVGGGGAGVAAAVYASEGGADVLMICKGQAANSGDTIMIGGSFSMDGTSASEYGYEWASSEFTKEELYDSIVKDGFYLSDQDMVEQFVEDSPEIVHRVVEWSKAIGRPFIGSAPSIWNMSGKHMGAALGYGIKQAENVTVMNDCVCVDLLKSGETVCGAVAMDIATGEVFKIRAKSVVLATGGMQPFSLKNTNYDVTGDGAAMALRAGASVADMEFFLFLMSALEPKEIHGSIMPFMATLQKSFKYVAENGKGEEMHIPESIRYLETESEIGKLLHIYYYGTSVNGECSSKNGGFYLKLLGTDEEINRGFDAMGKDFEQHFAKGYYHRDSVDDVRAMCLKKRKWEVSLGNEYSLGGVLVNADMQSTLAGLFAAGECASGVFGAERVADATTEMLAQGKKAGESAAMHAKANKLLQPDSDSTDETLSGLRGKQGKYSVPELIVEMENIADKYLGCFRNEQDLSDGLKALDAIEEKTEKINIQTIDAEYNTELIHYLALRNRLLCARVSFKMALERRESRGLHLRADYPYIDNENYLHRTIAKLNGKEITLDFRKPNPGKLSLPEKGKIKFEDYLMQGDLGLQNVFK